MMQRQAGFDTGYTNLLSHLRQTELQIPQKTLYGAIGHYLVQSQNGTALTAFVVSSPLWRIPTFQSLLPLGDLFGSAVRTKWDNLGKSERGIFDGPRSREYANWVRSVLSGLEGGPIIVQLAIVAGVISGVKLRESKRMDSRLLRDAENVFVRSFVEISNDTVQAEPRWEQDFVPLDKDSRDISLLILARFQSFISSNALSRLDLEGTIVDLRRGIEAAFLNGSFLRSGSVPRDQNKSGESSRPSTQTVERGVVYTHIGPLSKLLARTVSLISDNALAGNRARRKKTWEILSSLSISLQELCRQVDEDWASDTQGSQEDYTGPESEDRSESSQSTWGVLKTLLFSVLMVQQAVLNALLFLPRPSFTTHPYLTPSFIARSIVETLFSLSFVISSFGGVGSGGASNDGKPSFPELTQVFYMAIDIMAEDANMSETFTRNLTLTWEPISRLNVNRPYATSKLAFIFSCIEMLVSVLNDNVLENSVLPLCEISLDDSSRREAFEASHSVMLAIFTAHVERDNPSYQTPGRGKGKETEDKVSFVRRLIPGYAQILLKNAKADGLTTAQLRLAYAALVRSCSTSAQDGDGSSEALSQLCISRLVEAIQSRQRESGSGDTLLALKLSLISLISAVSVDILPHLLSEIKDLLKEEEENRAALIRAIYEEVLEKTGDAEKELVLTWWFELQRGTLSRGADAEESEERYANVHL